MEEDKQLICSLLLKALQATRGASDVMALEYSYDEIYYAEFVTVHFSNRFERIVIGVTGDSGTAMIRDIMKYLGC